MSTGYSVDDSWTRWPANGPRPLAEESLTAGAAASCAPSAGRVRPYAHRFTHKSFLPGTVDGPYVVRVGNFSRPAVRVGDDDDRCGVGRLQQPVPLLQALARRIEVSRHEQPQPRGCVGAGLNRIPQPTGLWQGLPSRRSWRTATKS